MRISYSMHHTGTHAMSRANTIRQLSIVEETPVIRKAPKARAAQPTKAEKESASRTKQLRQQVAYGVGGVGVGVLTLSVFHCTEAITMLTGSHWALAGLLAIGIDAGMVMTELAELLAHDKHTKYWSRAYIALSVAMSMGLNAYAFSQHATVPWAGGALGVIIPALVLILGRVAGHLAK